MAEKTEEKKPEGFYLQEVVTGTDVVLAYDGKQVNVLTLVKEMANHLEKQTGFKLEEKEEKSE